MASNTIHWSNNYDGSLQTPATMQSPAQMMTPSGGDQQTQMPGQLIPQTGRTTTQSTPNMQNGNGTTLPYRQGPPPVMEANYIPGYLQSNIGNYIRAEFIIGNAYLDKAGKLIQVGVNYFVLEDFTGAHVMCDLYSVKFVSVVSSSRNG